MTDSDRVLAIGVSLGFARGQHGLCFAATPRGLFVADAGLQSWRHACALPELPPMVTSAAFAPGGDILFAGATGGVLRTADGGQTCIVVGLSIPPPVVSAVVVSPSFDEDGTLLVGTVEDGIFRSDDRGSLWSPANFGLLDLNVLALVAAEDRTFFAGTESGIFRSTNGGRAWRESPFPMDAAPVLSLASVGNDIFAGTETAGLFRSGDAGKTWARVSALDGAVNQIIVGDHRLLILHNDELLLSDDGGQEWQAWNAGFTESVTAVAAPDGIGQELLVGLDDGRILSVGRDSAQSLGALSNG